jgi:hypothetical protein
MLVVDEAEIAQQMLQRVQVHIGLTPKGMVHIRDPEKYRQRDKILLYLIGVRYAAEAKMRESEAASLSEICDNLGIDSRVTTARLTDLKNEGKVESESRGEYRIVFPRLGQILNEIEDDVGAPTPRSG